MSKEAIVKKLLYLQSIALINFQPDGYNRFWGTKVKNLHYELGYHFSGTYRLEINRHDPLCTSSYRKPQTVNNIEEFTKLLPKELVKKLLAAGTIEITVNGNTTHIPYETPNQQNMYRIHDFGEHQLGGEGTYTKSFAPELSVLIPLVYEIIEKQQKRITSLEETVARMIAKTQKDIDYESAPDDVDSDEWVTDED